MAAIEERVGKKRTTFRVIWRRGKEKFSQSCDSREQAETWKLLIEQTNGDPEAANRALAKQSSEAPTVREVAERRIDRAQGAVFTGQTYHSYLRNHIVPAMGSTPVDKVTEEDLWRFVKALQSKKLSAKYIQNIMGFLSGVFEFAVARKMIAASPYSYKMLPPDDVVNEHDKFLTLKEAHLIISHMWKVHQDPARTLLATGMRPAEMRALNVEDLHLGLDQPVIRVTKAMKEDRSGSGEYRGTPKSKRSIRSIGISPSTTAMLRGYVADKPIGTPVFLGKTGNRIHENSMNRSWIQAAEKARGEGLAKKPVLYSLRHTHASLMLDAGMDLWKLANHLGHDPAMTKDIYGHLMPTAHYEAASFAAKALESS